MTDRYYRLITILINVCPDPLRELFLKHAKADPDQTTPYKTLDAYLTLRKTDFKKLKSRKLLRQDQWNLIFPQQGQVNINQWDITLLSLLLKELFPGRLQPSDKAAIDDIRDIRNNLQHIAGTALITDSEFANIYTRLQSESIQIAHSAKGKTFAEKIKKDIETIAYSVIADTGNVQREWYTTICEDKFQQLKEQINNASVKRVHSCGKVKKRLGGDTRHELIETDPHYKNLLVQSTVYCKHHRGQFTDDKLFQKALDEFRSKKVVVISGPRGCGKTSLALKLLSSYQGHNLILTEPEDLAYIRFGMKCVLLIEDLGGKYEVEKSVVQKWFQKFDILHAAVKDGKLNVIVTCDFDRLNSAIPATYRHPLLESILTIPTLGAVKVKVVPTTDEQAQSQGIYRRISFSSARTDTKELLVPGRAECEWLCTSELSQFRDGSFLLMNVDFDMFSRELFHFSSDLEYISRYRFNENIDYASSVCCTDGGDVLITQVTEVNLYRLSDESCTLKQSIDLQEIIFSVNSNINEIYVVCDDKVLVLNEKLEKYRTIEHFPFYNEESLMLNMVLLRETLFHIDENKDIISIDDTKAKEIMYLRKGGFQPQCLCAANDNSVFVFGRQGDNDSRILQVDTKMNVLSDITITNKTYSRISNMIFDRANARLIKPKDDIFELIYLK